MVKKRNRIEIIHEILKIVKENKNSIRPTPLLRHSNLSSERFSEYLQELLSKEFLKEIKEGDKNKYYTLSDKGFKFLEKYEAINSFIRDFDL